MVGRVPAERQPEAAAVKRAAADRVAVAAREEAPGRVAAAVRAAVVEAAVAEGRFRRIRLTHRASSGRAK